MSAPLVVLLTFFCKSGSRSDNAILPYCSNKLIEYGKPNWKAVTTLTSVVARRSLGFAWTTLSWFNFDIINGANINIGIGNMIREIAVSSTAR